MKSLTVILTFGVLFLAVATALEDKVLKKDVLRTFESEATGEAPPPSPFPSLISSSSSSSPPSVNLDSVEEDSSQTTNDDNTDLETADTIRVHFGGGFPGHSHGYVRPYPLFYYGRPHRHHHHHHHHRNKYNRGQVVYYG